MEIKFLRLYTSEFFHHIAVQVLQYEYTLTKCLVKKKRWELLYGVLEKIIFKAAPYKTPDLRSLTTHLTKHTNKTSNTQWDPLRPKDWTHKGYPPTHSFLWSHYCWTSWNAEFHRLWVDTGCRLDDLPWVIADRDVLCWKSFSRQNLMVMMTEEFVINNA